MHVSILCLCNIFAVCCSCCILLSTLSLCIVAKLGCKRCYAVAVCQACSAHLHCTDRLTCILHNHRRCQLDCPCHMLVVSQLCTCRPSCIIMLILLVLLFWSLDVLANYKFHVAELCWRLFQQWTEAHCQPKAKNKNIKNNPWCFR